MSEEKYVETQQKYKLVPPDGGWGYVIWISVILINITTQSMTACFGVLYKEFMDEVKMDTTSFAVLNGINGVTFSLAGFAAGPLLKTMSERRVAFIGATISFIGNIGIFWSYTMLTFFIYQGVTCAGGGFMINVSFTIINHYFEEKRLLSITLTQSVTAFFGILTPIAVTWSLDRFGYRGSLMLQAGITLQCFVAAALMQPVDRHLKRVPINEDNALEEAKLLIMKQNPGDVTERKDVGLIVKIASNDTVDQNYHESDKQRAIEESLENHGHDIMKKKNILKTISEALGLSMFKKFSVLSTNLGLNLCTFADITFTLMLPQALYSMKWENNSVARSLTLAAFGDLATRILMTVFSRPLAKLGNKNLYIIGLAVAVITRLGMLGSESETAINIYLTIMGVSRCTVATLFSLVLADSVDSSMFPQALGMAMLIFGVGNMMLGPVIGAIRDLTNSYASSFYILTSFFAIVLMFWCIELCYVKNQKKQLTQKIKANKHNKPK